MLNTGVVVLVVLVVAVCALTPTPRWQITVPKTQEGGIPVIRNGVVFLPTGGATPALVAASIATGKVLWTFDNQGSLTGGRYVDADDSSLVFFATYNTLYGISQSTGNVAWTYVFGHNFTQHAKPTYAGGNVYLSTYVTPLHVIEAKTGLPTFQSTESCGSKVWISGDNYVYMGYDQDGKAFAVARSVATNAVTMQIVNNGNQNLGLLTGGTTLFLVGGVPSNANADNTTAYDIPSGRYLWSRQTSAFQQAMDFNSADGAFFECFRASGTNPWQVSAFNATTGNLLWESLPSPPPSLQTGHQGVFTLGAETIQARSASTGSVLWSFNTGGTPAYGVTMTGLFIFSVALPNGNTTFFALPF